MKASTALESQAPVSRVWSLLRTTACSAWSLLTLMPNRSLEVKVWLVPDSHATGVARARNGVTLGLPDASKAYRISIVLPSIMEEETIEAPATQDGSVPKSNDHQDAAIDRALADIAQNLPLDREEDVLSRQEMEVLELFAELKELELEQAILRAEVEAGDGTRLK
jgi:hypothetical protein